MGRLSSVQEISTLWTVCRVPVKPPTALRAAVRRWTISANSSLAQVEHDVDKASVGPPIYSQTSNSLQSVFRIY